VTPAVFETAELVRTSSWVANFCQGGACPSSGTATMVAPTAQEKVRSRNFRSNPRLNLGIFLMGIGMFILTLVFPKYCYPFVWTSLLLMLEPINRWLGRPNFLEFLQIGDWRPIIALSLGALICGFFWEMWNFYSWPKWIYHTPGAQFLHVFEMPLLGYLGYIPFALELFALKNFIFPRLAQLRL
jgi:hypothetical protein